MPGRRRYLASLGASLVAGLSGCGGIDGGFRAGTSTDDGLDVESGPVNAPDITWSVEKQSAATDEEPCQLRITLENTGSTRKLSVAGALPFPTTPGSRPDGEADVQPVIVPVDDRERRAGDTCWQAPVDDPGLADDAPWDWGYGQQENHTLEAGERLEGSYHVVAEWTTDCFQPGEYLFERRYELDGKSYEWHFTLAVPSTGREL